MTRRVVGHACLLACAAALAACGPGRVPASGDPTPARPPAVRITFVPQSPEHAEAAREYERLWAAEGERIVRALEAASGLSFVTPAYADTAITAIVVEAPSNSGYRDRPMRLRASYPPDTKRATLAHELGHRLQEGLFRRDEEEHGPLFLWLYDAWVALWTRELADAQVAVERRRGARYVRAWDDALALSPAERAARWRALRDERMPTRREPRRRAPAQSTTVIVPAIPAWFVHW